jgi:hypothetical protein
MPLGIAVPVTQFHPSTQEKEGEKKLILCILICNVMVSLCAVLTLALQTEANCEIKQFSCGNVFKRVQTRLVTHFS